MECRFFSPEEFKRCTPSCSIEQMDSRLLILLDDLRAYCNEPIHLLSAYRSVEYELSKGRAGTSSHTKGLAVDIRCTSPILRYKIMEYCFCDCLRDSGFRLGIAKNFLHIDIDREKPWHVVWTY